MVLLKGEKNHAATKGRTKAVKETFNVCQSAKDQSKNAVQAAIQLGSNGELSNIENLAQDGKHIWVPFEKVTKDNVKNYIY
ncbi:ABC-type sugar transport system substrate-binding protein [Clostridium beijerinckii]|uniref:hypothetical protein n=1 Tax=Clostridium beijerinckii TaxID=1520 RepID=UPI001F4BF826|nr:hypothetical protein [Clostridium beijerinckii]NOW90515.1 ABC-type sugar transport system substrate-binding protein [Clostridium beijerinckii]